MLCVMINPILYQATCYLPYSGLLLLCVFIAPALALFPRLILNPLTASAIPTISILIVDVIASGLIFLKCYQQNIILWITGFLILLAVGRLFHQKTNVGESHLMPPLFLLNIGLVLPLVAISGFSAFMSNDALASWNYWALHYYHQQTPNTLGYPPFFSLLLSYCYKLLGNTEYQGAVKATLIVFPLTMLNAIACSLKKLVPYLIIISICIIPG